MRLSLFWRVLAALYGILLIVFGLIAAAAQLSFARDGCMACWAAIAIMLALAALGAFFVRVAVAPGVRR